MEWSRAFKEVMFNNFLERFCKYYYNVYKTQNFANSQLYLQFLKVKLSNDVSFVIFGHQTWDLEREGAKITPPPWGQG